MFKKILKKKLSIKLKDKNIVRARNNNSTSSLPTNTPLSEGVSMPETFPSNSTEQNMPDTSNKKAQNKDDENVENSSLELQHDLWLYNEIMPEIMACCIMSDGEVEQSELDSAYALVYHDDFIINKKYAIDLLEEKIKELEKVKGDIGSIIDIRFVTLEQNLQEVQSSDQIKKIKIVLDALSSNVKSEGREATKKTVNRIIKQISKKRRGYNFTYIIIISIVLVSIFLLNNYIDFPIKLFDGSTNK
ncbi:MAG: hypothetical protein HON68_09530 [Gammaproteobacteria bacterium]|jgi:hypothetical protein|nr:hypothetical protein [Gammaproteobacteria bacterium]MBT5467209.1 hypothetical protein [Candidatus Neomarinimicrobiota bacterium]MBT3844831.1 hypothetical protein [Gammaproteobacteria bacterium]MBT4300926.1 hypothetical protein [Gammaproteobacteria bacterium]MBT4789361.1 hypothetical protein [Gammaproteobacteria bacterium]